MIIQTTGRHVEITDAIRDHVERKVLQSAAEWPRVRHVHVVLNLEKQSRCIAEVVLQAENHGTVESRAESHDMYLSVDQAVERAGRQVLRWKQKVQRAHKIREGLGRTERDLQDREA